MDDDKKDTLESLSRDTVELIARKEADRGRNQAFAVFAALSLVFGFIGVIAVYLSVENALEDDQIQQIRLDAEEVLSNIEDIEASAEAEFDRFTEGGGYQTLVDRIGAIQSGISSAGDTCRTINGRDSSTEGGCTRAADWLGRVSCNSSEFMRSITVVERPGGGPNLCYFVAECCNLPSISPVAD